MWKSQQSLAMGHYSNRAWVNKVALWAEGNSWKKDTYKESLLAEANPALGRSRPLFPKEHPENVARTPAVNTFKGAKHRMVRWWLKVWSNNFTPIFPALNLIKGKRFIRFKEKSEYICPQFRILPDLQWEFFFNCLTKMEKKISIKVSWKHKMWFQLIASRIF